jgi:uncharacterized membrane protein YfcA
MGAGFASGLLGVGGGFVMVPVQFWMLKSMGIEPDIAIRVALGTNLLVVLFNALNGALAHHKRGAVVWRAGITLGIASVFGAYLGAIVATHLPVKIMTLLFGAFIVLVAIRMLTAKPVEEVQAHDHKRSLLIVWGFIFGIFSGTLGVAGGGIYVPVMVFVLKFTMHQAVATSMVTMVFSAAGGSLSFMINGLGMEGLPPYSTGYVNWLQWVLLSGCGIPMAHLGARFAHRLKGNTIKYIFVTVLIYLGLKMTGVFEWLHLPI